MAEVQCSVHGSQSAAYVCQHLFQSLHDIQPRGFICDRDDSSEYPDAWCIECDEMLARSGGEWTDELGTAAGVRLICGQCYLRLTAINGL